MVKKSWVLGDLKVFRYVWLYWFIRVGRFIELLEIRGLSEAGFVVCFAGDPR